ncbi:urease accessory protein UreF [Dongia sp.]|uniref:urease accessory protein UreF n=1 Tax=Dongia sp. TaxID=1977262 RepID=UPI0035AEB3E9
MDQTPIRIKSVGTATRLLTWLSPAFPVGGFCYSHGLEYAVEAGLVRDRGSLENWIDGILRFGAGRSDGLLLLAAHRATIRGNDGQLRDIADQAAALRGTAELAQESIAQGQAFLKAVGSGWPEYAASPSAQVLAGVALAYSVAVGALCAVASIAEDTALEAYLAAFAANLVSAGVRLIPLGQSDGLRILAALEGGTAKYAANLIPQSLDDIGNAAVAVDWSSMQHETQYTRLFRS